MLRSGTYEKTHLSKKQQHTTATRNRIFTEMPPIPTSLFFTQMNLTMVLCFS